MRQINHLVIHCAATPNGKPLSRNGATAAQVIDEWHFQRGFHRSPQSRYEFNPDLKAIGYHFIIDVNGKLETGRGENEIGAHVKGHNHDSLGICLVGGLDSTSSENGGKFTKAQWATLHALLEQLKEKYPNADILGHRDFAGVHKACPSFPVKDWLKNPAVETQHTLME